MSMISVSIVTFHPDLGVLKKLLEALEKAVAALAVHDPPGPAAVVRVADNSVDAAAFRRIGDLLKTCASHLDVELERMPTNLGYGQAHNHCFEDADSTYHLVLNPDVLIEKNALLEAVCYLEEHTDVGMLTPRVSDENGAQSYLAKRVPSVLDLLLRGFAPHFLRRRFAARLQHYEMRDVIGEQAFGGVPIASGCFMFFRTELLRRLGGFDSGYFMYFEDFDLCMRLNEISQIAYVPSVRITHFGGGAAKKGWSHIRMFSISAFRFFNRWGWKWS